ncbi:MAG: hypothetical protein LBQ22_00800 [Bacteroidales bacterium]|jgi:hypothetical protein|nr:hypothetical protein [Bacteroidales bacterium]
MKTTSELLSNIMELLSSISNDKDKLIKVSDYIETIILNHAGNKNEEILMEKYTDTVSQILSAMDAGVISYFNPDTMELEQAYDNTVFNMDEFAEQNEDRLDDFDMAYKDRDSYIEFPPLTNNEQYEIMEKYIFQLDDDELSEQLEDALSHDNSVNDFKSIIGNSEHFSDWESFKTENIKSLVMNRLIEGLQLIDDENMNE